MLNVALNFLLIPPFGIIGAALATALTYGALAVLYYRRAQRFDPVGFETGKLVRLIVLAAAVIA